MEFESLIKLQSGNPDGENQSVMDFLKHIMRDSNRTFMLNQSRENISQNGLLKDQMGIAMVIIQHVELYVMPLVAIVGLTGNLISFAVFVATYMRRLSSSLYLAALSMVDMVFLICVLLSWGVNIGINVYQRDGWCQMFTYLTYVSSFLSVWYVISFTVERYIAVHYPLRRYEFCTTNRAKMVVLGLACFAALIYSFGTWTSGVIVTMGIPLCAPLRQHSHLVHIVNNIDTIITLILPFIAILFMNVRIALKVVQFYRTRRTIAETNSTVIQESDSAHEGVTRLRIAISSSVNHTGYLRNQVRVTKMLLTVSSIFLLLNLPRHLIRVYHFIRALSEPEYLPHHDLLIWQKVFTFLYHLHFCVNVFLYSALGANFRKAFFCLLRRVKHVFLDSFESASECRCHLRAEAYDDQSSSRQPSLLLRKLDHSCPYDQWTNPSRPKKVVL